MENETTTPTTPIEADEIDHIDVGFMPDTSSAIAEIDIPEKYRDQVNSLIAVYPVSADQQKYLVRYFAKYFNDLHAVEEKARAIVVTDRDDVDGMAKAREMRLSIRRSRLATEKIRKSLKEESLRYGRFVDGTAKLITEPSTDIEEHLLTQEEFRKNIIRAEMERVRLEREKELEPFVEDVKVYALAEMSDEQYALTLIGAKTTHEQKIAFFEEQRRQEEEAERIRQESANRLNILSSIGLRYVNGSYELRYEDEIVRIDEEDITTLSTEAFDARVTQLQIAVESINARKEADLKAETERRESELAGVREQDRRKMILIETGFQLVDDTFIYSYKANTVSISAEKLLPLSSEEFDELAAKLIARVNDLKTVKAADEMRDQAERERLAKIASDAELERKAEEENRRRLEMGSDREKLLALAERISAINLDLPQVSAQHEPLIQSVEIKLNGLIADIRMAAG